MIKKILQKIFYNPYKFIRQHSVFIKFGDSIVRKNFYVRFNNSMKQCLTIGNGCILECEVIYETSKGNVIIGDGVYI